MVKDKIILKENELKAIINESIKKIISEGSTETEIYRKWQEIIGYLGNGFFDVIWEYLDSNTLSDLVNDTYQEIQNGNY